MSLGVLNNNKVIATPWSDGVAQTRDNMEGGAVLKVPDACLVNADFICWTVFTDGVISKAYDELEKSI